MLMLRRKTNHSFCAGLRSRNAHGHFTRAILYGTAQSKCTWTCHKRHFVRKFTGKMPYAYPGTPILREPARSKCTWTGHKRHFMRKFAGKMPDATSIEHRTLTLTVRPLQCGHTVWGIKQNIYSNWGSLRNPLCPPHDSRPPRPCAAGLRCCDISGNRPHGSGLLGSVGPAILWGYSQIYTLVGICAKHLPFGDDLNLKMVMTWGCYRVAHINGV